MALTENYYTAIVIIKLGTLTHFAKYHNIRNSHGHLRKFENFCRVKHNAEAVNYYGKKGRDFIYQKKL